MTPELFQIVIAALVPILVFGLKCVATRLPKPLIPPLAAFLGAALDWAGTLATNAAPNPAAGALAGFAGVGLRELIDQVKKSFLNGTEGTQGTNYRNGLALLLVPALLLGPGCRTLADGQLLNQVAVIAGSAARLGTQADLQAHPEHRAAFEVGRLLLDGFLNAGDYDAAKLQRVLGELPIREFRGENGALIIEGAVLVYSVLSATLFDAQSAPAIQTLAVAIRDGIERALEATAPPAAVEAPIKARAAPAAFGSALTDPTVVTGFKIAPVRRVRL